MKDNLNTFFSENNFDFNVPHNGHFNRFERKLNPIKKSIISWKWMSIAACFVLFLGFCLGTFQQNKQLDLADFSPKMEETQNYFVATINQEIKELEKHRSLDTETIIEDALDQLEELEDTYKNFITELNKNGYEKRLIYAMINNYQKRLEILENVLTKIEDLKNNKNTNTHENYI